MRRPSPVELGLILWAITLAVAILWAAIPAHAQVVTHFPDFVGGEVVYPAIHLGDGPLLDEYGNPFGTTYDADLCVDKPGSCWRVHKASQDDCHAHALLEINGYFAFIGYDPVEAQRYAASVGQPYAVEKAIQGFIKSRCGG